MDLSLPFFFKEMMGLYVENEQCFRDFLCKHLYIFCEYSAYDHSYGYDMFYNKSVWIEYS